MSVESFNQKEKTFRNGFRQLDMFNRHQTLQEMSSSESSNSSDSDETSSCDEFVIQEGNQGKLLSESKTKNLSPNSLKRISNQQKNSHHQSSFNHHPFFLNKTKSLPVIFERSDESSISSQSIASNQGDSDSTLSNCSDSSSLSSSSLVGNRVNNNTNSKETENLNGYHNGETTTNNPCGFIVSKRQQPIIDERNNNIDYCCNDKLLPALLLNYDVPMYDSLNCNQSKVCENTTLEVHTNTTMVDLDTTQHSVSVSQSTKINKPSSLITSSLQSDFIVNKRTPRFPVKNQFYNVERNDSFPLNNVDYQTECDPTMQTRYNEKQSLMNRNYVEPITDLDDIGEHRNDQLNKRLKLPLETTKSSVNENNPQNTGSFFKTQMLQNYSKTDMQILNKTAGNNNNTINRLYDKRENASKTDSSNSKNVESIGLLSSQVNSPKKKIHDLAGNVAKMDKTVNRVTDDIVRIDNAIDKLSQFNKNMMASLEMVSDAELSSDFDVQSIGAQTDAPEYMYYENQGEVFKKFPEQSEQFRGKINNISKSGDDKRYCYSSSETNDSSTEKESNSDSDDSIAFKPSPVHQRIEIPNINTNKSEQKPLIMSKDVTNKNIDKHQKLSRLESDLSSLAPSSIWEEPERRNLVQKVKYFQREIKKSSGLYKHPPNIEPPKKLVVEEPNHKPKSFQKPIPKPRNSLDGTLTRHMSNSSSESSTFDFNSRTLSNSNNHTQISPSPINSDSGSIISLNSNHFERRFQKGGTSARYNSKTKLGDKWGNGSRILQKSKMEEESESLSGKTNGSRSLTKSYMAQSRSYNSLNVLNPEEKLRSGSLATLNKHYNLQDIDALCNLIQHNLNLNNHDRIQGIFSALVMDNNHDRIDEIIDRFYGDNRDLLIEIAADSGYGLKDSESIFDMTMSRTDLHNNLRSGISMSSINDAYYQQGADSDKMVYWRADIEELLPPPMKPPPKPMPTNLFKSAIISPESLIHVDNKVIEVLELEPTTFTELVAFLTRDCSKDVEKVRALFRWITMYDIKSVNFDPAAPNDTLVGTLRAIKCGQMSNNELFFRMCRFAGIHCQFISGYSKGAGYRPGMAIKDNRMFRNVWTAVFVAGAWRFVNCNWGARYLSSRHQEISNTGTLLSRSSQFHNIELKHRCDEFYFLTDAKQHIFEHFPDKKRWQLLNRPITLEQFMALPIVKSPFFNANLSFKRNYADVLQTKKGKVTVKLNMPQAIGVSVKLENRVDGTILQGLTLVRILDNQMIVVTASPSQPGKFYLSIYVNDNWKSDDNMEMACSFQIHCSEHNYDRLVTGRYPDVGVLGPTPASQNLGIITNPGVDPFVLWEDRSVLKLNIAIQPGLRVGHRMMSYDRSGQNSAPCDSYALLQYQNQGRSQYHLRFPVEGFYCLTIYAGLDDPHVPDTEPMECIYRLLIDCKQAQERIPPFPRQTSRWVGFRLIEPQCQHLELNSVYRFRIIATNCSSMCVVINDTKWIDLAISGENLWKGKINTGQELENLSVFGQFGNNVDDEFIKLLDYILIPKTSK